MKKIILDTNFLTIPYQFGVDIFEEIGHLIKGKYELFTTSGVIKELEKLTKTKGKHAVAAKIALDMLKEKNIKIIKTKEDGNTDETIIQLADEDTIVATNDRLLRKKLKDKNVKIIYLRAKKYLVMG